MTLGEIQHWMVSNVSVVVALSAPLIAGLFALWVAMAQRGHHAKQVHIVELATKRTQYWSEYLKTSESINGAESDRHAAIKSEADGALARIRAEADEELTRISYGNQITRVLRRQEHTLLPQQQSVGYVIGIILFVLFLVIAVVITLLTISAGSRKPDLVMVVKLGMVAVGCAGLASFFYRLAIKSKYPEPSAPLLDRI